MERSNAPSSTDLRFGQLLGAVNQQKASKWINSSENNRNLNPDQYVDQTSSAGFDGTSLHVPELTSDRSHVHSARNITLHSTGNREDVSDEERCKITAENSKSHSFDNGLGKQAEDNNSSTCFAEVCFKTFLF